MAYVLEVYPEDSSENECDQIIEESFDNGQGGIVQHQRRMRSTKEQLIVLDTTIMESHNGLDDEGWIRLTNRLNELGPPERSVDKWKRILSVRKYNRKQEENSQLKQSANVAGNSDSNIPVTSTPNNFYSEILKQLVTITQWLEKIDAQLKSTNSLLQTIANKCT